MAASLDSAFPGTIKELHIEAEDNPEANLLQQFSEVCNFIGTNYMGVAGFVSGGWGRASLYAAPSMGLKH